MQGELFLFSAFHNPTWFFQYTIAFIASIFLHELGHGLASIYLGDEPPLRSGPRTWSSFVHIEFLSVVFFLITGMAWGGMPFSQKKHGSSIDRAVVAAAGPLTNFALALLCTFLVNILMLLPEAYVSYGLANFFWVAATANIAMGLFNLLPVPPLDGFYLFKQFIPKLGNIEGTRYGFVALYVLFLTGLGGSLLFLSDGLETFLVNA